MAKRIRYTPEQSITKLREAEVYLSQGKTIGQACKTLEISDQTYYRWRREYGGMDVTQARKLKEMEKENTQLGIFAYPPKKVYSRATQILEPFLTGTIIPAQSRQYQWAETI